MKKLNLSLIEVIILIVFLCSITLDVFFDFIMSLYDLVLLGKYFNNPYNFVKFISNNSTVLCEVVWINKLLLLIASFIPAVISFVALKGLNLPSWANIFINIVLYYVIIQLFSSLIFWIVLGSLILAFIIFKIISVIKAKKNQSKQDEKLAKN